MALALVVALGGPARAADDAPRIDLKCYDVEERARIAARIVAADARVTALENEVRSQPSPWALAAVLVGVTLLGGLAGYGLAVSRASAPPAP